MKLKFLPRKDTIVPFTYETALKCKLIGKVVYHPYEENLYLITGITRQGVYIHLGHVSFETLFKDYRIVSDDNSTENPCGLVTQEPQIFTASHLLKDRKWVSIKGNFSDYLHDIESYELLEDNIVIICWTTNREAQFYKIKEQNIFDPEMVIPHSI